MPIALEATPQIYMENEMHRVTLVITTMDLQEMKVRDQSISFHEAYLHDIINGLLDLKNEMIDE